MTSARPMASLSPDSGARSLERLAVDLVAELKQCSRSRDLDWGRMLHARAIRQELHLSNRFVGNSLISMYAKCGRMVNARKVFDSMVDRDIVSWNALLQGYLDNGQSEFSLELFLRIDRGLVLNPRTFVTAITACAASAVKDFKNRKWLETGKKIHTQAVSSSCDDQIVQNALIKMYASCRDMVLARQVFDRMVSRSLVSWNTLLQGYADNDQNGLALDLFETLEDHDVVPDSVTYVAVLTALANQDEEIKLETPSKWLEKAKSIHSQAVRNGQYNQFIGNTLVAMYGKCRSMLHAQGVFDKMVQRDVVTWTALILGYVQNGDNEVGLELFDGLEAAGCVPNARTYVAALSACINLASKKNRNSVKNSKWLQKGKAVHAQAVRNRCYSVFVESTLITLYSVCGTMVHAQAVFDSNKEPNTVSWTGLIMGYLENGENELALQLIARMNQSGIDQDSKTFVAALMACSNLAAVETGEAFHEEVRSRGLDKDAAVACSLINFYGKCSKMDAAKQVFDSISEKDVVAWNSLMCGYGLQGDTEKVFETFERMKEAKISPNGITFISLLTACSHAGLTHKGKNYFERMQSEYGICPARDHYSCMLDLLGRANHLDEALKLLNSMPFEADSVQWLTLLAACRKWNNVGVAKIAYEALLQIDGGNSAAYCLMANIYGAPGMWESISS